MNGSLLVNWMLLLFLVPKLAIIVRTIESRPRMLSWRCSNGKETIEGHKMDAILIRN